MPDLERVKGQVRFHLAELSIRNEHHGFERLCEEVAKARICSNVVPATGPVSAGGDQGRDFETFRTYLEGSDMRESAFLGMASQGTLVFACSTEKEPAKGKIRADVDKIMASGETPERIYFFCTDNVPVGRRHALQEEVWQDHGVRLEILDGHALAEHLSAPDLYWAAEKYLNLPSGLYPAPSARRLLLPPSPHLLRGREDDLLKIKWALGVGSGEAGSVSGTVVAVHGWPGVGKTTFVSALCRDAEVLEHFPGGVFFLSVGRSPDTRRLAETLCAVLEIPAPSGTPVETLRGRIACAFSEARALIVFDDVWEDRHVAPLLVGGDAASLVTTRRADVASRLATAPEGPLRLHPLSREDSLRLIESRAPGVVAGNAEACRELAGALDGLPLALRVAADLLRVESESGFDVSALLAELTEVARVLGEEAPADAQGAAGEAEEAAPTVRALLQKSVERLGDDLLRHFARLGVLPPKPLSFSPWAAQEVWRDSSEDPPEGGTTEEEQTRTREALGELVRRGLVEPTAGGVDPLAERLNLRSRTPERFWMHALVAAFALEVLGRTEGEGGEREAQQRRLEHYRRIVGAADGALSHGGEAQLFSVYLMALDLPNIRAAHEWARSRPPSDRRALGYLSRLPSQGSRALSERLTPNEFLEWMRLAEDAARETGDDEAARTHMANVGAALTREGRTRDALRYCEESLRAARQRGDALTEAAALANLASIRDGMGEDETALDLARQAEKVANRAESPDIEAGAIGQQAASLEKLGRIPEAEGRYEDMRDLAQGEGELSRYAKALRGLAGIRRNRPSQRDEARRMYEEAAEVFWDLKEYANYRSVLNGLGILEAMSGALDVAEEAFGRVLESAVEDGDRADEAQAKMNLGNVSRDRGTEEGFEAAEAYYREALLTASKGDNPEVLGDASFNLAQLLREKGDERGARAAAEGATQAYADAKSSKESWARDLLNSIGYGNAS
jgi:tetratricopeptide (TPR) repeat protein